MPRLYIQMTEDDKRYLAFAKTKLNKRTNHDALISLIESNNFSNLCWLSMVEHELRKIAINIRQLSDSCVDLAPVSSLLSETVTTMESITYPIFKQTKCIGLKSEVQVPVTDDEKKLFKRAKLAIKARSYRCLILTLVKSTMLRNMSIIWDELFPILHSIGVEINTFAKEFNTSGYTAIDEDTVEALKRILSHILNEVSHVG